MHGGVHYQGLKHTVPLMHMLWWHAAPGAQAHCSLDAHAMVVCSTRNVNTQLTWYTGDGGMRVWKMGSSPTLMCTIRAAVNRLDCVNSMCCDSQYEHVIVGDTGGHVRVWSLHPHLWACTDAAAQACFTQVSSTLLLLQ